MKRNFPGQQRGYNLVEVLIAMALVGVVTLSILTLFSVARSSIYSGKESTQGLALGTHALEDLSNMTLQNVYDAFAINSTASPTPTLGTYVIDGVTYQNVMLRSTDANILCCEASVTTPQVAPADLQREATPTNGSGLLTLWRTQLLQNRMLQNGSITIVMAPRLPTAPVLNTSGNASAQLLRVRVIVRWQEALRKRSIVLDASKIQRAVTTPNA